MSISLDFVILNDVIQDLPGVFVGNPPEQCVHYATIKRREHEYMIFGGKISNTLWIEEVVKHRAGFELKAIESDAEWADLYRFAYAAGFLSHSTEKKHANPK
jgi:hypothetical protein